MNNCRLNKTRGVDMKLMGLIALAAVLLIGVWLEPSLAEPSAWEATPATTTASAQTIELATPAPAPVRVSMLDVLGKIAMVVLLVYGVGFALSRYRGRQSPIRPWRLRAQAETGSRLQLCDTLVLPRQEGLLYLVELDGQRLLVGATPQQLTVTWAPRASEETTSFTPISKTNTEILPDTTPDFTGVFHLPERKPQAISRPVRNTSEWAQERRQLINALMQAE